jgi:hypothetical protein
MAVTLHETVDDVGAELQQELADQCAKRGPPGRITVCEDETFHPGVCLVAVEPASNFILVEGKRPANPIYPHPRRSVLLTRGGVC